MHKEAYGLYNDPKVVADAIREIIKVMISRMSHESQMRAYPNIAGKVNELNIIELSQKKNPGGASIGVSISLIKNILNGRDPQFIKMVLDDLSSGI